MTQRKEISQLIIKTGYVTHVTVKINDYIKLSGLQFQCDSLDDNYFVDQLCFDAIVIPVCKKY